MLATVTGRARTCGAKLLVRPDGPTLGTLGDPDLDRVVARDALGELEAGPHRRPATTACTARRAKTRCRSSSSRSRRRRGWSSSARSTSPPRWPGSAKVLGYRVDGVRRAGGVRDRRPLPDGRRGRERLARPLPREGRRRPRAARRGVRAHPRHQVRRARDRRRAGAPASATSARWARAAPTTTGSSGCARRASTTRAWLGSMAPIGLDIGARTPGGDRDLDLRRDHRRAHRAAGGVAAARPAGPSTDPSPGCHTSGAGVRPAGRVGGRRRARAGRRRCAARPSTARRGGPRSRPGRPARRRDPGCSA